MTDHSAPIFEALLEDLRMLVAHASIMGDEHALDRTAMIVAELLRSHGLQASVHYTEGAPIVLGHLAGRTQRRILFYNHYDVAPPGPWREWRHEPFALSERDGTLYGRGVASDKGNLLARLGAVSALLKAEGELPVGVSFLIEGDALTGSPHLPTLVADQASKLQADLVLGPGGTLDANQVPLVYAGVRGRLMVTLRVEGPKAPLSSDMATSVLNPAWRIIWALAEIKNDGEEVLIDGFYDSVAPPSREANKLTRGLQIDEEARLAAWGLQEFLFGMTGATLARAETFNPTCNVSLLNAGHGLMPTIPSTAEALLDFSLVPEQRPNEIARLLREFLARQGFHDIAVETVKGAYPPAATPLDAPALTLLYEQIERVHGRAPQHGTLAPYASPLHLFTAGMNVPACALGMIQPSSSLRGANEALPVSHFRSMINLVSGLLAGFGEFDSNP